MPKTRPAFVHDLGFDLGNKILGFFVDDGQQIFFPFGEQRVVIADKQQQILVRVERDFLQIGFGGLAPAVYGVKRVVRRFGFFDLALPFFGGGGLFYREIAPALERQRVGGVDNASTRSRPMLGSST